MCWSCMDGVRGVCNMNRLNSIFDAKVVLYFESFQPTFLFIQNVVEGDHRSGSKGYSYNIRQVCSRLSYRAAFGCSVPAAPSAAAAAFVPGVSIYQSHNQRNYSPSHNSTQQMEEKYKTNLVSTPHHTLLPLHLHILLLLRKSQCPRNTQQESRCGNHPKRLSAKRKSRFCGIRESGDGSCDATAGLRGDNILESDDAVVQGFVDGVVG